LNVYLVRHGQAGTREAYDSLSELGKQQSRSLGEHFLSQTIRFRAAYTGTLARQQQTLTEVSQSYASSAVPFPAAFVDPGWNEFDLGRVYREIAPQLCAQDSEFRREYEKMLDQIAASHGAHTAGIHRKWQPCDTKIVNAWISGQYRYRGETWDEFRARIEACRMKMQDGPRDEDILVVTSAMPIAIWSGRSLEISDERLMRLAGVLHNASYSIVRLRETQLTLFTFNATPHLPAELRTHR
jgi:broad specificity phosphatase PhoE